MGNVLALYFAMANHHYDPVSNQHYVRRDKHESWGQAEPTLVHVTERAAAPLRILYIECKKACDFQPFNEAYSSTLDKLHIRINPAFRHAYSEMFFLLTHQ